LGFAVEDACDELVSPIIVIEHPGSPTGEAMSAYSVWVRLPISCA
jgi:hypothetical protein